MEIINKEELAREVKSLNNYFNIKKIDPCDRLLILETMIDALKMEETMNFIKEEE